MDRLKESLFKVTLSKWKTYQRLRKAKGLSEGLADTYAFVIVALYDVIDEAGLEEEYRAWVTERENEREEEQDGQAGE